ncbi:oligosaccharide flippase family protein [Halobacteriaceae archaeon SHR40]|uniref:oligosaccharide flippase family protein n=1 Tax=Halovenus amylolytica TaxID=2500550 RepID=UPI000FE3D4D5
MKLGQTSFIHFISKIGSTLAGFVATIYFARVLGADILGTYFLVIAVLTWLKLFSTMGISRSVMKRISETDDGDEFFTAGLVLQVVSLVIVSSLILAFQNHVQDYTGFGRVDVLLALLFAGSFFSFVTSVLVGERLVHISGILDPLDRISRSVAQIALVMLGFNLLGMFIGYVVASIVSATVGIYFISARLKYPKKKYFVSLWSYAKFSWLGNFSNRTLASMDTIILGLFVSSSLIGIYEIAWNLASVLAIFGVSISQTLFPEISNLSSEDSEEVTELAQTGVSYAGLFLIPGLVGGFVLGDVILSVYGQEFRQGSLILVILILARLISTYKNQFVNIIDAVNRPDVSFKINGIFVITNISLNFVFVYLYGWIGAAVATVVSAAVGCVLGYISLIRLLEFRFPSAEISKQLFSALVMGAVVYIGVEYLAYSMSMISSLLLIPVGAGIYFGVLATVSSEFKSTVRSNITLE